MTIKPPAWAKDAIPTAKGWKHPKRNEILVNKKFTQAEIDEYLGVAPAPKPTPEPVVETKPKRTGSKKTKTVSQVEPELVEETLEQEVEILALEPTPEPVAVASSPLLTKLKSSLSSKTKT